MNSKLRRSILLSFDPDFISLNKTHLTGQNVIDIDGYTWFGQNRKTHIKTKKGSGGVDILIKNNVLQEYEVLSVDKSEDGIACIQLKHAVSKYSLALLSCYLPPEGSTWSDPQKLCNDLLVKMYNLVEFDAVYVCGDFNGRIGHLADWIHDSDLDFPLTRAIDDTVNSHGEMMIEFLRDSKSCVLNGRIFGDDNFTSISVKGRRGLYHHLMTACMLLLI